MLNSEVKHHLLSAISSPNQRLDAKKYNNSEEKFQELKIWYSNVTSLNNKYELFKFEIISNRIDIAFVSETWWTDSSIKISKATLYIRNQAKVLNIYVYTSIR